MNTRHLRANPVASGRSRKAKGPLFGGLFYGRGLLITEALSKFGYLPTGGGELAAGGG